jgi:hypothetical protein
MDLKTFTPNGSITIQQVLTRIKYNPTGESFSIGFCRATSKIKAEPKGQIVWYDKALYGAPPMQRQINGSKARKEAEQAKPRNFKTEGTLPIHNTETKEFKTPLIASIMFFDGKSVKHPDDDSNE